MLSTVLAINWDQLINETAPNLTTRTIGSLLGGGGKMTGLIVWASAFAGILLLLYLIYGGFQLLISGGDPKKTQSGKQTITHALLGFIIIFIAYWLVQIIGLFLGLTGISNVFTGQ